MIKRATLDDYAVSTALAKQFAKESYGDLMDDMAVTMQVIDCTSHQDKCLFLYDDYAFIAGVATWWLFGNQRIAYELAWYVDPEKRGSGAGKALLEAFEGWAKEQKANLITMIAMDDSVGDYYKKQGYTLYERTYMKEI